MNCPFTGINSPVKRHVRARVCKENRICAYNGRHPMPALFYLKALEAPSPICIFIHHLRYSFTLTNREENNGTSTKRLSQQTNFTLIRALRLLSIVFIFIYLLIFLLIIMFKSKSSDVGVDPQRRSNANVVKFNSTSSSATLAQSDEHSSAGRVAGIMNSSSSHIENQLRNVAAPIVSVISSSMDFFGSNEANVPPTVNHVGTATTTSSHSVSATLTAPSIASEISKYGVMSTNLVDDSKTKKSDEASSSKPKSIKRAFAAEDDTPKIFQKKSKQRVEVTGENSSHSLNQSDEEKHALDMSFERAAVVAALTTLYGATNEKINSRPVTNTNTAVGMPLQLPKQVKNKDNQVSRKDNYQNVQSDTVEKTEKEKAFSITANAVAAVYPHCPPQLGSGETVSEAVVSSTIKLAPQSSKKKGAKSNEMPSNTRKSTITLYPTQYDVLLGRGKSNKNHPGNVWFQGT